MVRYILQSSNPTVRFELCSRTSTVGRNPGNQLCLNDPSVSSFHAELTILPEDGGLRIRDLQSTNGTFLNGEAVIDSVAIPGHSLQFGGVEFQLEAEAVEIKVPTAAAPKLAQAAGQHQTLGDGTLACSRNPGLPATHQALGGCGAVVKCPGFFATPSLRSTKLAGGTAGTLLFCPDCNARCEAIPGVQPTKAKKQSFFARLTQTVQMSLKS